MLVIKKQRLESTEGDKLMNKFSYKGIVIETESATVVIDGVRIECANAPTTVGSSLKLQVRLRAICKRDDLACERAGFISVVKMIREIADISIATAKEIAEEMFDRGRIMDVTLSSSEQKAGYVGAILESVRTGNEVRDPSFYNRGLGFIAYHA